MMLLAPAVKFSTVELTVGARILILLVSMPSSTSMTVLLMVFQWLLENLLLLSILIPPQELLLLVLRCVLPTERVLECSLALLLITLPLPSSTYTPPRVQCNKCLNILLLTLLAWMRKCYLM